MAALSCNLAGHKDTMTYPAMNRMIRRHRLTLQKVEKLQVLKEYGFYFILIQRLRKDCDIHVLTRCMCIIQGIL